MMQMEKLLNHHCDMELMKMAMLKHEKTFRHQVRELHRLYRVQKQLMSGPSCRRQRRKHPRRALDLHLPADEYIVVGAGDATPPPSREDGLELTLAVGGRKRRGDGSAAAPLASSDCSGGNGSPSSSSSLTDTSGSPYKRAVAFRLQEGTVARQQQQAPWLVQCLSLRMA